MFTKIGAFLGTLAFAIMMVAGLHAAYEVHNYVPKQVVVAPTLQDELKSTVAITMEGGYCSGWVLKGSHTVVTAAHCGEGGDPTQLFAVDFGDGKLHPFHEEKIGDSGFKSGPDLMTLTTSDTTVPWPAGMAVCTFKPYYGEYINLIGGPLGYSQSTTFGRVSNPDRNLDDDVMGPFGHFIQYDGALEPGNSGGPAIDAKTGCVMGVGEMSHVNANNESGVPFIVSFLTPASELGDVK
jgi:serine protease Do